jgi:hypothetical protein
VVDDQVGPPNVKPGFGQDDIDAILLVRDVADIEEDVAADRGVVADVDRSSGRGGRGRRHHRRPEDMLKAT